LGVGFSKEKKVEQAMQLLSGKGKEVEEEEELR
jgi:hypothetical protein